MVHHLKRTYGRIGVVCWLLILPAKFGRYIEVPAARPIVGVIPSLLGPAGLLFVLLSSEGRLGRLSLPQITAIAATVSALLEFAQLLPGIRRIYTFDWTDLVASLASVGAAAFVATRLRRRYPMGKPTAPESHTGQ